MNDSMQLLAFENIISHTSPLLKSRGTTVDPELSSGVSGNQCRNTFIRVRNLYQKPSL